ncbi:MAG: branched-chain amino acid ABC transporter permease [Geminicoccaceae bacterium]
MISSGLTLYLASLMTMGMLYGILCLGLNIQWGLTGLFNAGIAGFFAIGAYTAAILSTPVAANHLGGFGLPIPVGLIIAMVLSGLLGWAVGRVCIRLKSDYLAIATIGIAEILRLIVRNEEGVTAGSLGIKNIPKPFGAWGPPLTDIGYLALVLLITSAVFAFCQRIQHSPWGRTMRAIRDNETAARAMGKDVDRYRLQAFAIGSAIMGLGGALQAHYFRFLSPEATEPLLTTFLVWVMLIAGGSGNNKGTLLSALVIWILWSGSELLSGRLPGDWAVKLAYIRIIMVGLLLQLVLRFFPGGLLPEQTRSKLKRLPATGRDSPERG